MESVNKSFDVNKVFDGVEKSLEKYDSVDSGNIFEDIKLHKALSVEVVSGLTDILKNVLSKPKFEKSEIANRFCEFVDMISSSGNGALWSFASDENDGEVLISFLKELAADKKFVTQIDSIFRSGSGNYPLVNWISCDYKKKFNELFKKLPEWYQNKLLGETIIYEEGDKIYTYSLIGGSALMGF